MDNLVSKSFLTQDMVLQLHALVQGLHSKITNNTVKRRGETLIESGAFPPRRRTVVKGSKYTHWVSERTNRKPGYK